MTEKPTESAQAHFRDAYRHMQNAKGDLNQAVSPQLATAVMQLALGLDDLSVALRATYMQLAEVKSMLERQGTRR